MTDETENLVLEHLRHIRSQIGNIGAEVQDMKLRLSSTERHMGEIQVQLAGVNSRLDRHDERLGRIERRLELVEV